MSKAYTIRRLEEKDDRQAFSCGDEDLDRFFRRYAGQNQFRHHLGTSYVAVEGERILGFATVSATQIEAAELPSAKKKSPYPLPALRLARLGVSSEAQGQGVGSSLLVFVLRLACKMADDVGCVGVVVDAKVGAVDFYERLGFLKMDVVAGGLGDRPLRVPLFLALEKIPKEGRMEKKNTDTSEA